MKVDEALLGTEFYLCDLGLALQAGTSVSRALQGSAYYQAPERFHGVYPSYSTDMWSYMCIFAELCVGFTVFRRLGNCGILGVIDMLGPLPEAWKGTYTGYGDWDTSWYDPRAIPNPEVSLEARVLECVQGGPRGYSLRYPSCDAASPIHQSIAEA
jgi:serine/threonine protein kinase